MNTMSAPRSQTLQTIKGGRKRDVRKAPRTFTLADFIKRESSTKRKQTFNNTRALQNEPDDNPWNKPLYDDSYQLFSNGSTEAEDFSNEQRPGAEKYNNKQPQSTDNIVKTNPTKYGTELDPKAQSAHENSGIGETKTISKQGKDSALFTESFITVQAVTAGKGISDILDSLIELQHDSEFYVTSGDSLPLCFSLGLKNSQSKPYIVAKQSNNNDGTWMFSLQGSSESQSKSFRDKMTQLCHSEDQVSLHDVIEVGQETLDKDENYQDLKTKKNDTSISFPSDVNLQTWDRLTKKTRQEVSIVTAEEAAEILNFYPVISTEPKTFNKEICSKIYHDTECGVCFSPCRVYGTPEDQSAMMLMSCGHAHCLDCWKDHVYHSIYNGASSIACMTTYCDMVVDETTLRSLVPASVVTVWQSRLRGQFLESSDFVSWCPNGQCGQLAVSNTAPLKKQFGSPLTCTCRRSWCSNCHDDPHWPVSCDQMKAYKKLLFKTEYGAKGAEAHTFYQTDLKKCPKCKYPFVKEGGCPSVVCQQCLFNFCWVCLKSVRTHDVYICDGNPRSSSNFTSMFMINQVLHDLPMKYFLEVIEARRDLASISQKYSWLAKLQASSEIHFLSHRLRADLGDKAIFDLVDDALSFMKDSMAQIELFYVILFYIRLNKTTQTTCLTSDFEKEIPRLNAIIDKLNFHVVGRPLAYICAMDKEVKRLLRVGASTVKEMFALVPILQQASQDVDTKWVDTIDISEYMRYK